MARRTYIPGLEFAARTIIRYVTRYREQIRKNLSPQANDALDLLVAAAETLLAILPDPTVNP